MKKSLLSLLLGLALGVGGMLWLNRVAPETAPPAAQVTQTDFIEFTIKIPEDIIAQSHGIGESVAQVSDNTLALEGNSLGNMVAVTARVRDKDGNFVGIANELEAFPDDKGPRPGIAWKADWIITTSQGTLYTYEDKRVAEAHLGAFAQVASGENWAGSIPANISFGPHPSGRGIIIGGSGIYARRTGTFVTKVDLQSLTTEGKMVGVMYLQIYLDKKKAANE